MIPAPIHFFSFGGDRRVPFLSFGGEERVAASMTMLHRLGARKSGKGM
jgi:hypothetical protein